MSADPTAPEPPAHWRGVPPLVWKSAVVLYMLFLFGLAAAYLTVAAQGIEYSITVSGDEAVCVGRPAALRVGVMDLQQGRYLVRAPLELHLDDGQTSKRLFTGFTSPAGLADVNVEVPTGFSPGAGTWEVRVPTPDGGTEVARVGVLISACGSVRSARPEVASVAEDDVKIENEGTGPMRIDLVAEGGTLVDGLPSTLFVRVTHRETGEPVRTTVAVTLVKGFVDGKFRPTVRTDAGGLGTLALTPVGNQKWKFVVVEDGVESTHELILKSRRTQHVMTIPSPVWRADSDLRVSVKSLRRSGEVYGDLYGPSAAWVHGVVSGVGPRGGGFSVPSRVASAPRGGMSVLHVQAYADPLAPGGAGDMRYVVVPSAALTDRDVLRQLLKIASKTDGEQAKQAAAFQGHASIDLASDAATKRHIAYWLSLYPRDFVQPKMLMNSRTGQEAEMAEDKAGARETITWLLSIAGSFGLLVVLWLVLGNFLAVRRAGQFAAAELDLEMGGLHRAQAIIQLVFLFATIVIFFASIVALLRLL
jgi:hypothetical protein